MFKFTKCLVGVTIQLVGLAAFGVLFAGVCVAGNIEGRLMGDEQPGLDL